MSAIWRAEVAQIQRAVRYAEREKQEAERRVAGAAGRRASHAIQKTLADANKETILAHVCAARWPISANAVAAALNFSAETTRKHLKALAKSGDVSEHIITAWRTKYWKP